MALVKIPPQANKIKMRQQNKVSSKILSQLHFVLKLRVFILETY
jgi:hypothetical protein